MFKEPTFTPAAERRETEEERANRYAEKAEGLSSTYKGDEAVWQTLTQAGITDREGRTTWFQLVKKALHWRKKRRDAVMRRDAEAHERGPAAPGIEDGDDAE